MGVENEIGRLVGFYLRAAPAIAHLIRVRRGQVRRSRILQYSAPILSTVRTTGYHRNIT